MLITLPYNRGRAVLYARRWAFSRNPLFSNFSGIGGDCTNFISQCIYAGSCVMNYTPTFGWYYRSANDRAPAWTGVEFFYNFMTGNDGVGPFAVEVDSDGVTIGDVIQLADETGDYYHTLLITGFEDGTYLVAAHSDDSLDRPLTTYMYATARYLRIEGVRLNIPDQVYGGLLRERNCFPYIFSGGSIGRDREEI